MSWGQVSGAHFNQPSAALSGSANESEITRDLSLAGRV